ncbi:MAG: hypothetical protein Q4C70_05405 [Planctomycetia bacterium]|nr:hypothetical protein [Planctomycetia bacterium]
MFFSYENGSSLHFRNRHAPYNYLILPQFTWQPPFIIFAPEFTSTPDSATFQVSNSVTFPVLNGTYFRT